MGTEKYCREHFEADQKPLKMVANWKLTRNCLGNPELISRHCKNGACESFWVARLGEKR